MSEEKLNPINVTGAPLVGGSYRCIRIVRWCGRATPSATAI